eukprot:SM000273S10236  [mRNA]  locus=s273:166:2181:+ [translate_table: standard]
MAPAAPAAVEGGEGRQPTGQSRPEEAVGGCGGAPVPPAALGETEADGKATGSGDGGVNDGVCGSRDGDEGPRPRSWWRGPSGGQGQSRGQKRARTRRAAAAVAAAALAGCRGEAPDRPAALAAWAQFAVLGFAVATTRSLDLSWQARALRALPVFLLPALGAALYTALSRFFAMRARRDQALLERLQAERHDKIEELKEKSNYYVMQQLIQQYDTDPAAKAAAASVLLSRGLPPDSARLLLSPAGDAAATPAAAGQQRTPGNTVQDQPDSAGGNESVGARRRGTSRLPRTLQSERPEASPVVVGAGGASGNDESNRREDAQERWHREEREDSGGAWEARQGQGWVARLAAMLVGEDPTQCYALICEHCHAHNGKCSSGTAASTDVPEDYGFVTYYCPRCNHLNGSSSAEVGDQQAQDPGSATQEPRPPQKQLTIAEAATQSATEAQATEVEQPPLVAGLGLDAAHVTRDEEGEAGNYS